MSFAVRCEGQCASCGAPIVWCATTRGNRMPVDPEPVADGNLLVDGTLDVYGRTHDRVLVLTSHDVPLGDPPRYVSHFQSCPDAVGWRRAT